MIFLFIILTLLSCYIFILLRRNTKITPEVSFYPPKGLSSAEVGLIYYEKATNKELISLIIYLASKGYIKINNCGYNLSFELLKPYDGRKRAEKMVMHALFPDPKKTFVTKEELESSMKFYTECDEIVIFLNNLKKSIFDKYTINPIVRFIPLITMILITIYFAYTISNNFQNIFRAFQLDYNLLYCFAVIYSLMISQRRNLASILNEESVFPKSQTIAKEQITRAIDIVIGIAAALCLLYLVFTADINGIYLFFCFLINFLCFHKMPQKNKEAVKLLSKILGFKKFIETAEKKKIELLSKKDPNYCSEILPYAYVFGVSNQWTDKIKNIFENDKNFIDNNVFESLGNIKFMNRIKLI